MGVPAFFRWLTKKYPSVIVHCIEDKNKVIDGTEVPVDTTTPNPNGVEFDNLYLDMNGIIHPCTHPEDKPAPKNEDEMMVAIFECIDRLFRIVRPRKLLYMAIDGVAPRAKMNQQRSRRFRASKETYEKMKEIERVREDLISRGLEVPPEKPKESHFDSNCITPGTPFMDRLSKCLHYFIHDRLNNDPGWRGIKVILSDANVPGEGEHKIMDYIRRQRAKPDHDPNTAHCLCGADADLIMLGLATHEPNFTIIREEFKPNKPRPCDICGQLGHEMKDCLGLEKEASGEHDEISMNFTAEVEFIFVRINVLREYLERELTMPNLPFPFELERVIDDWVFMCFFVGNDFLPHLPSLEIRENAIDRLVNLYKKCVYKTGGFLTNSGIADLNRLQLIVSDLGEVEDTIFQSRQENEIRFKARMKAQKKRQKMESCNGYNAPSYVPRGQFAPVPIGSNPNVIRNAKNEAYNMRVQGMHTAADGSLAHNRNAAAALKAMLRGDEGESPASSSVDSTPASSPSQSDGGVKRKASSVFNESDEEEEPNDEVRLWEEGFKDRYYESKFDVQAENVAFRHEVAKQYVIGMCWVLRYYYQGCASWEWYFPYHYAPFASDFVNVGDMNVEFPTNTVPFSPLEQLMGVFPAASKSHVPEPWGKLMWDPDSEIIDFYPEDFQIDLNGKKYAWQGVALLPFVDEKRLKSVLKPFYEYLTDEEKRRNIRGSDRLYVRKSHSGYDSLAGLYENDFSPDYQMESDPSMFQGMAGQLSISLDVVEYKGNLVSPIRGLIDILENEVITVKYRDPQFEVGYLFPAVRLENAKDPIKVLKPQNLSEEDSRNWRPIIGMVPSTRRAQLDPSAHRALAHHGYDRNDRDQSRAGQGQYSNMAPPAYGSRSYNQYDRGNSRQSYSQASSGGWRGDNNSNTGGSGYGGRGGYNSRGGGNNWGNRGGSNQHGYSGGYSNRDNNSGRYESRGDGGRGGYSRGHNSERSSYSGGGGHSSGGYGQSSGGRGNWRSNNSGNYGQNSGYRDRGSNNSSGSRRDPPQNQDAVARNRQGYFTAEYSSSGSHQ
ncbi:unnamed protein product [Allacma fusca]|uniref:5'-3' exoribonuclease n=1 Tax=Allacma fusca TaxID=39272 RepID=A0A8J2PXF1_9HEXA|nr:unnamed protein product [Allacma fusca]